MGVNSGFDLLYSAVALRHPRESLFPKRNEKAKGFSQ